MHSEMTSLQQDLVSERAQGRTRHSHLVETLTAALQARDAALGALKRLESFCHERHLDVNGLAVYEVCLHLYGLVLCLNYDSLHLTIILSPLHHRV